MKPSRVLPDSGGTNSRQGGPEVAADGLGRRPREASIVYWGAVGIVLFGAGVAGAGVVASFDIEPLGVDPFTDPCFVFFLAVVVLDGSGVVPPTVALALAAEPTLADGSDAAGAAGPAGATGAVGVAEAGAWGCAPIAGLV